MEPLTDTDHLMIAIASFFPSPTEYHTMLRTVLQPPNSISFAGYGVHVPIRSPFPIPIFPPSLPLSITAAAAATATISTATHHAHSLLTYRRSAVSLLSPSLFTLLKSFPHVTLFSCQALPAFP